ncbi:MULTISPECIES: tRNA (guanosine(46)-N7)-methyltransferase TrmB [Anaerococcus]|uniref:tRNA (guanine-N(7)-)-methyltransferase n=1 Tax=Anaerococcus nagyae TaxID=1755241 RepID=A0A3E2TI79_9FIRM|nr:MULTISPECIES: tRNA (guanosine(46)-N7)-methyltransferase TrmB [Anaerococcus]MBP2069565.1 tRNA (guanine-N7-)-methyltransferase [Anaerococcus nagyae]MDU2353930.1 tRNA (guanosine(46)-N7)-methyltransferase TrmB [Anaerococcus sp.]MDU2565417.1 tRNA (guanosine(46)-N7)-methyltransferase TrmB [Anaerococcus sp.]MDU3211136.1 tRNA (guanosine(46)-N7)-methyltransferase TrmB [Anaerococcus sp.]RGB76395.1 tRNA (guanosine(46)-N7)-methyltransferase TrmB [Anaerococcus nagyae]
MRLRFKPNAIPEMKGNDKIFFYPRDMKDKWCEVFNNENPIHLEIGAGKGDFIVEMAKRNPGINFIALEMNTNAFVIASRKIEEEKLENVIGLVDYGEELTETFGENEIDHIYINFSTPWPKTKHHKRRLSHPRFLERYKIIMKDGGIVEQKTDDRGFFDDSLKYYEDFGMEILYKNYDLLEEESIVTEYEKKWRDRNKPIYYAKAKFR